MSNTKVRLANKNDLKYIANIHKQQFSSHFLGQFSVKLLERFYECFFDYDTIFIVSETDGIVSGFIVGGKLSMINLCTSLFIKKNIPLYLREIIMRPSTWRKSCRKFINVITGKGPSKESLDYVMEYTLLSIAVSSDFQGKNVAKDLIVYFDELMKKYSNKYFLSVMDSNSRAIRFYEKMGFFKERHFNGEYQLTKVLGHE